MKLEFAGLHVGSEQSAGDTSVRTGIGCNWRRCSGAAARKPFSERWTGPSAPLPLVNPM